MTIQSIAKEHADSILDQMTDDDLAGFDADAWDIDRMLADGGAYEVGSDGWRGVIHQLERCQSILRAVVAIIEHAHNRLGI